MLAENGNGQGAKGPIQQQRMCTKMQNKNRGKGKRLCVKERAKKGEWIRTNVDSHTGTTKRKQGEITYLQKWRVPKPSRSGCEDKTETKKKTGIFQSKSTEEKRVTTADTTCTK